MVKFRRSLKGDKHDASKLHSVSVPQKDAIAITPPKKVIKALYDYTAPTTPPHYLSFSAGDFLHVVSRENDLDWYEACNPLQNTRGLVPVKYFETIGKQVRDSGGSTTSVLSTTHDSGYAEGSSRSAASRTSTVNTDLTDARQQQRLSRLGKSSGAGVYGIVSYDFHAERPDELEAKEGEAIIVIAQSNPEWFVAKPITRLGGPGLIPVSFIEIRDTATGKPVPDAAEAVARAGIPRVEEWKKMAAEYKNTSIPLGQFSNQGVGMNGLQSGMDRMSLGRQSNDTNGYGMSSGHQRTASAHTYQQSHTQQPPALAPIRASVPRYLFADDKFWFIVEATASDNSHWDLSRVYEDFYDLQISLIKEFPLEAGQVEGTPRILPYMPGPVAFVTDKITDGRRANLDEYLQELLRLGPHIAGSQLVRNFFTPREGDYEIDPEAVDTNEHGVDAGNSYQGRNNGDRDRYSQQSHSSSNTASYPNSHNQSQNVSVLGSRQSSSSALNQQQ
ncbi:bud emergence protein 1, partial [Elasticomyces elasticus]